MFSVAPRVGSPILAATAFAPLAPSFPSKVGQSFFCCHAFTLLDRNGFGKYLGDLSSYHISLFDRVKIRLLLHGHNFPLID